MMVTGIIKPWLATLEGNAVFSQKVGGDINGVRGLSGDHEVNQQQSQGQRPVTRTGLSGWTVVLRKPLRIVATMLYTHTQSPKRLFQQGTRKQRIPSFNVGGDSEGVCV